uniref:LOX2 n=1 Tax=Arundo donax TaxID=35708 RepID=A0A0A9A512_ARUDO
MSWRRRRRCRGRERCRG